MSAGLMISTFAFNKLSWLWLKSTYRTVEVMG